MRVKHKRSLAENGKEFSRFMRGVIFYRLSQAFRNIPLMFDLLLRTAQKKSVYILRERLKFLSPLYKLRRKIKASPPSDFKGIKQRFKERRMFNGVYEENILLTRSILENYNLVFSGKIKEVLLYQICRGFIYVRGAENLKKKMRSFFKNVFKRINSGVIEEKRRVMYKKVKEVCV